MSAGIYLPSKLRETDPILFEALCLKEVLARLGYERESEVCSAKIMNPKSTMYPEQTKQDEECLCVRVRSETYVNEVHVIQDVGNGKLKEHGVGQTRAVELMIAIGPLRCTPAEFPARWAAAEDAFKTAIATELLPLVRQSRSVQGAARIAEMLRQKGFEVRR